MLSSTTKVQQKIRAQKSIKTYLHLASSQAAKIAGTATVVTSDQYQGE